jgi:hypothetical protein
MGVIDPFAIARVDTRADSADSIAIRKPLFPAFGVCRALLRKRRGTPEREFELRVPKKRSLEGDMPIALANR